MHHVPHAAISLECRCSPPTGPQARDGPHTPGRHPGSRLARRRVPSRTPFQGISRSDSHRYPRARGYKHKAVKIFLPEGAKKADEAVIVEYTKEYAPDTNAARFWLLNRRREQWRERQEVAVTDPIAAMSPEQRLAQVVEIMAKARALLAEPDDDDVTDAEYEETEG
jgi:hypothetical protein